MNSLKFVISVGEEEMDEETKYHLQKVFSAKETEEERLIRLGEMTPFGTDMAGPSTSKQARKIIIPENKLTDFDKFLLSEAEAKAKKNIQKIPQRTPQKEPSSSQSKSTVSVPKIDTSKFKTFTDIKAVSRTRQKSKVKLGSRYAKGYTIKKSSNRSLIKNYRSDSDVSEIGLDTDDNDGSDEEYLPDQDLSDGWEDTNDKKG